MSSLLDLAVDRLIHAERLRHDIAAYRGQPLTDEDGSLGDLPLKLDLDDDDIDYEALFAAGE